jgi:phospholipase C
MGNIKMKFASQALLTLACLGTMLAHAQISSFRHIVVIVQENRTPDNLFQGLCAPPFGTSSSCSTRPMNGQYNIQTSNWLDKKARGGVIQPLKVPLASSYDLGHGHVSFMVQCDLNASGVCKMDDAAGVQCGGTCPSQPQFRYVDNSTGVLNPYLELAKQYGWGNYMFQTNQGPSFPAHQFIFGGTSAPSRADDALGIFAAENVPPGTAAGCIANATVTVDLVTLTGENVSVYPCFEHETIPDLLPVQLSWRYYAPGAGSIWTAPNAIEHICQPNQPANSDVTFARGVCEGPEWQNNVDLTPANVLNDISNCSLRSLSWVIPSAPNSDHPSLNDGGGPSWVASIVNAIGSSTKCDNGTGYWKNTAIIITWDDWGGWYDHEPPTILAEPEGDYQYGFRVPLIVVSAYTPASVNNIRYDFGSVLRFIEHNFDLGSLGFADARSTTDLSGFFNLSHARRPFHTINAPLNANFFLNDKRPPEPPDID